MRNVTVSLDEETARWVRIEAAEHDVSVSRYVGRLLRSQMHAPDDYDRACRSYTRRRTGALSRQPARYPSRDEVHQR